MKTAIQKAKKLIKGKKRSLSGSRNLMQMRAKSVQEYVHTTPREQAILENKNRPSQGNEGNELQEFLELESKARENWGGKKGKTYNMLNNNRQSESSIPDLPTPNHKGNDFLLKSNPMSEDLVVRTAAKDVKTMNKNLDHMPYSPYEALQKRMKRSTSTKQYGTAAANQTAQKNNAGNEDWKVKLGFGSFKATHKPKPNSFISREASNHIKRNKELIETRSQINRKKNQEA